MKGTIKSNIMIFSLEQFVVLFVVKVDTAEKVQPNCQ
jgi:hypothetical protein